MKRILYIAILAIICWSCNKNNEVVEPKQEYQEGQKVTIKVATHNQNYGDAQGRKIEGTWAELKQYVDFVWQWEGNEKIKVLYNGAYTILDCTEVDEKNATFEGEMPAGWQEGNEAIVIAGDITNEWPISDQGQIKTNGIASNMMRFEGTMTQVDETVELKAVWTAFRFPVFYDALDADKEQYPRLPNDTKVKGYTKCIDITAKCNGVDVAYHYDINALYEYSIQSSATAGQNDYAYYICVVKPGVYTDLSVAVTHDLNSSSIGKKMIGYNQTTGLFTYQVYRLFPENQSNTHVFGGTATEVGKPSSFTLESDWIYTPDPLDCKFYYTQTVEEGPFDSESM